MSIKDRRKGHDHEPAKCGYLHGMCTECGRRSCGKLSKRVEFPEGEGDVCITCYRTLRNIQPYRKKNERMRNR